MLYLSNNKIKILNSNKLLCVREKRVFTVHFLVKKNQRTFTSFTRKYFSKRLFYLLIASPLLLKIKGRFESWLYKKLGLVVPNHIKQFFADNQEFGSLMQFRISVVKLGIWLLENKTLVYQYLALLGFYSAISSPAIAVYLFALLYYTIAFIFAIICYSYYLTNNKIISQKYPLVNLFIEFAFVILIVSCTGSIVKHLDSLFGILLGKLYSFIGDYIYRMWGGGGSSSSVNGQGPSTGQGPSSGGSSGGTPGGRTPGGAGREASEGETARNKGKKRAAPSDWSDSEELPVQQQEDRYSLSKKPVNPNAELETDPSKTNLVSEYEEIDKEIKFVISLGEILHTLIENPRTKHIPKGLNKELKKVLKEAVLTAPDSTAAKQVSEKKAVLNTEPLRVQLWKLYEKRCIDLGCVPHAENNPIVDELNKLENLKSSLEISLSKIAHLTGMNTPLETRLKQVKLEIENLKKK